jgi:DNA repair exonuclease SbcCD ATPase subunit
MQKYIIALLLAAVAALSYYSYTVEQARRAAAARITELEARPSISTSLPTSSTSPAKQNAPAIAVPKSPVDVSPYLKKIDELREQLVQTQKEFDAARSSLEASRATIAAQTESLQVLQSELQAAREAAAKDANIAEALQAELKVKSQRMIQAEQAEKVLQDRLLKAEQNSRRASTSAKELEDLQRRREIAYTSIERRFREVSDIVRAFTLNAQTRETGSTGLQAGDLSRLQTTLQQAEEDFRQVRSLNARVADLAKAK